MCINIRVDSDMLAELHAEKGKGSLSGLLNKKAKHALAVLIRGAHKNE